MYITIWKDKRGEIIPSDDCKICKSIDEVKTDIYNSIIWEMGDYVGTLSMKEIDQDELKQFYDEMVDCIDSCRKFDVNPRDYTWETIEDALDDIADDFTFINDEIRGEIYTVRASSSVFQGY